MASLVLTGTAMVIGPFVGVPLGIFFSAVRQYSKLDFLLTRVTFRGSHCRHSCWRSAGLYVFRLQLKLVPIAE
jgi:ABC-type dipeptide/oligopeptide/nickel transport system permease component